MIVIKLMQRGLKKALVLILILFLLLGSYSYWAINRSVKLVYPTVTYRNQPILTSTSLSWPNTGQSAVGILRTNILDTHNTQTPVPTASTAKMVTALVVLQSKPLKLGDKGPVVTLTQSDVDLYKSYLARQGSVVPVQVGEQINEYQMLEAMFLPSANNMADSLATWAYGSLANYSKAANSFLASHRITSTKIGNDASGFNPITTSTSGDLVKIGELVMQNLILAQIVNMKFANDIPLDPIAKNVNYLLGTNNIIGIKTGNTDQAGGVYVSASKTNVNGKDITIITANTGSPTLGTAVSGSLPLITSSQSNFKSVISLKKGTTIGGYKEPWDNKFISAEVNRDLLSTVWGGSKSPDVQITMSKVTYPITVGSVVGNVSLINNGSKVEENIYLAQNFNKPSIIWKLLHP